MFKDVAPKWKANAAGAMFKDVTIGRKVDGSTPGPVKLALPTARHRYDFTSNCVVEALNRGDRPQHSSHAEACDIVNKRRSV